MPRPMPLVPPVTNTTTARTVPEWVPESPLMPVSHTRDAAGIAEVVVDYPPVNALPVQGWFDLADTVRSLGAEPATRVVILAAEGRGYNAGVDIKELQNAGPEALIGVNRGCF